MLALERIAVLIVLDDLVKSLSQHQEVKNGEDTVSTRE
jgi:hypothetical protein